MARNFIAVQIFISSSEILESKANARKLQCAIFKTQKQENNRIEEEKRTRRCGITSMRSNKKEQQYQYQQRAQMKIKQKRDNILICDYANAHAKCWKMLGIFMTTSTSEFSEC